MKLIYLSIAVLLLSYLPSASQGFTTDTSIVLLNDVVINENRLQIPFAKDNRNTYILDKKQIEQLPVQSLNELLSYVSGVDVRQRGPWGSQTDVSIDGGTFEQTTILVNGIKMNDPQTGHNSMNLPIPTSIIERIEVLRGPAARIYGINSLTGAINIVTKSPQKSEASIHVFGGSSFHKSEETSDLYHGEGLELSGAYATEKQSHLIAGSLHGGSGHRYNTAFKNNRIFYQGVINTVNEDKITLMGGYVFNDFGANGYYAAPIDKESREIVQTGIASIGYQTKLSENINIHPRVNYRYNYDDYRFYRNDLSKARNQHYTHVINPEVNANYHTPIGDIGLGAEARFDVINSSNIGDHKRNNAGLYAEFRTEKIKDLQLNVGAYVNYNSDFGWQVFPGIDLGYNFHPDWKLFINSGTAQRVPTLTDLYYDTPGNIGNENLNPENAWFIEGGFKYNKERLWMNASFFHREINDFIDWIISTAEQPWRSENFLESKTNGLTISTDYRVITVNNCSLLTGVSYTYLNPTFTKQESDDFLSKYLLESLKHQVIGKAILGVQKFSVTIAGRYQERINYKSYFITDARIAYRYKKYSIYSDATNIFDTQYIESGAVPMPGRWFSLGIKLGI